MNKQRVIKLHAMTEQLRNEYCEKFLLQDDNGSCYYSDESNKVDFCPFSVGYECIADDFLDSLYMIVNLLNEEEREDT